MNVWAEVDRLKAALAPPMPPGPWRAFCRVGVWRICARQGSAWLKVQRACHHVPGKWREAGRVAVQALVAKGQQWHLTQAQAERVLVERDRWLEQGARVRTRLPVLA